MRAGAVWSMMEEGSVILRREDLFLTQDVDQIGVSSQSEEVTKEEWLLFMEQKKAEQGRRDFSYFLNFLELEVPKQIKRCCATEVMGQDVAKINLEDGNDTQMTKPRTQPDHYTTVEAPKLKKTTTSSDALWSF